MRIADSFSGPFLTMGQNVRVRAYNVTSKLTAEKDVSSVSSCWHECGRDCVLCRWHKLHVSHFFFFFIFNYHRLNGIIFGPIRLAWTPINAKYPHINLCYSIYATTHTSSNWYNFNISPIRAMIRIPASTVRQAATNTKTIYLSCRTIEFDMPIIIQFKWYDIRM